MKNLDAGKGETIPTLQEVIDLIGDKVKLVIELKEEGTEGGVVELIKRNNLDDNVYVISFWHGLVKTVKEMDSRIKTGVLLIRKATSAREISGLGNTSVSPVSTWDSPKDDKDVGREPMPLDLSFIFNQHG